MLFSLRIQIGLGVEAHQIITQPMPSGHVGGSILQVVLGHAMHIQANLFHQCFSTTKQPPSWTKNRCQDSRSATLSSSCQKKCIRSSCGTYILYILSNLVVLRNENGHDNYYRNKITTNLLFGCLTVCGTGLLTQIIPVISTWNLKHPL